MKSESIQQIMELRKKIRYHEHRYYVFDDPEISDSKFPHNNVISIFLFLA